jgi:hypothetical protein
MLRSAYGRSDGELGEIVLQATLSRQQNPGPVDIDTDNQPPTTA